MPKNLKETYKMLILRKGKKTIKEYDTAYAVAEDVETLRGLFPA